MCCSIRHLIVGIFVSFSGLAALAQTAQVSGQVTDPQNAVVANAKVRVVSQETGVERQTTTNREGLYSVPFVEPGRYQVFVQATGFSTAGSQPLTLSVGQALVFNVQLRVGGAQQEVTVEASSSLLNATDASVNTVIDRRFVENIPLNGRSFQDLIAMTPGVVTTTPQTPSTQQGIAYSGDFSVNGQRTESNYYTVDGVTGNITTGNGDGGTQNGTAGALGGATALGTTQSLISVDALQEFRVEGSSYSAEYGHSPGGQFSLVTRSGTNTLHGSAFDYLRNNVFDANDWFNDCYGKPASALRQNDFGGTLGGPVRIPKIYQGNDRTFFFVSYEGLRLTQPTAASIQYVPDNNMRKTAVAAMQPILNAFPVQNGEEALLPCTQGATSADPCPSGSPVGTLVPSGLAQFISPFSLPSSIDSTSVRIDHTLTSKLSAFFRFGNTPSETSSRPDFALLATHINTQTYTLGTTSQLTSNLNNDFRLGYDRTDAKNLGTSDDFGGATSVNLAAAMGAGSLARPYPVVQLYIAGVGSPILAVENGENIGGQWNLVDTVSATFGRHALKFGLDYRRIKSPLWPADPEMFADFESRASILAGAPELPYILRFQAATPIFNETAAFVQDKWRVAPRWSVSLGLRWELNPPPTEQHGDDAYTIEGNISDPASLTVAPQGTPLWKTSWFNFAPRLGVAWTAHDGDGRETVVRAGGGVFYDNLNQEAALAYEGLGFLAYQIEYGATIPFTLDQLTFPISVAPPYTSASIYAFPSHVQLPYTLEWNTSLQQALGGQQAFTVTYVGANGRRLVGEQELSLNGLNPNFGYILYFPGGVTSNYQALQAQFQRSVSHGVETLASYTWSHSLDLGSTGGALPLTRGNSDFDVRNNFQAGLSWDLPKASTNRVVSAFTNDWGIDGRLNVRSGFPVPLTGSLYVDPATGSTSYGELNVVAGQPVYLHRAQYPGGRAINPAAFSLPLSGIVGNAPRNFVRGFGETQVNFAARREFHLYEASSLQFRAEAFNVLNHPNFGQIDYTYTDATFGQASQMLNQSLGTVASQYQQGGPRSMQFALKLRF